MWWSSCSRLPADRGPDSGRWRPGRGARRSNGTWGRPGVAGTAARAPVRRPPAPADRGARVRHVHRVRGAGPVAWQPERLAHLRRALLRECRADDPGMAGQLRCLGRVAGRARPEHGASSAREAHPRWFDAPVRRRRARLAGAEPYRRDGRARRGLRHRPGARRLVVDGGTGRGHLCAGHVVVHSWSDRRSRHDDGRADPARRPGRAASLVGRRRRPPRARRTGRR